MGEAVYLARGYTEGSGSSPEEQFIPHDSRIYRHGHMFTAEADSFVFSSFLPSTTADRDMNLFLNLHDVPVTVF